jgi:hypothetical protein
MLESTGRLEVIAGADNPYSLIAIFGRDHLAIKAGGAVYVARCAPVEAVPGCTETVQKNCQPSPMIWRFLWTLSAI